MQYVGTTLAVKELSGLDLNIEIVPTISKPHNLKTISACTDRLMSPCLFFREAKSLSLLFAHWNVLDQLGIDKKTFNRLGRSSE